ncbi:MAG TPA: hypothetical protein PKX59_11195 [Bacteroidia bacterium]|nr:hypothetical protein [Bacteroidia bacterium]
MIAEDMFAEDMLQIFDKKTGAYIGLIKRGEPIPEIYTLDKTEQKIEVIDVNQLSLF